VLFYFEETVYLLKRKLSSRLDYSWIVSMHPAYNKVYHIIILLAGSNFQIAATNDVMIHLIISKQKQRKVANYYYPASRR